MNQPPIPNQKIDSKLNQPLSPETVEALQELGHVFRRIHRRLISEGYTIRDGEIFEPGTGKPPHGTQQ